MLNCSLIKHLFLTTHHDNCNRKIKSLNFVNKVPQWSSITVLMKFKFLHLTQESHQDLAYTNFSSLIPYHRPLHVHLTTPTLSIYSLQALFVLVTTLIQADASPNSRSFFKIRLRNDLLQEPSLNSGIQGFECFSICQFSTLDLILLLYYFKEGGIIPDIHCFLEE